MERPAWIQILIERKGLDPTAITAYTAIRDILGMGEKLVELRRSVLHEIVVDQALGDPRGEGLLAAAARWLDHTPYLWNPNKERAWMRLAVPRGATLTIEVTPAGAQQASSFGQADSERFDHLLLWPREGAPPPADLARGIGPARLLLFGAAELYSLRWSEEAGEGERALRTEAVGPVRSRHEGLLVHPHFQDYRRLSGRLPVPLFGEMPDA